MTDDIVQRLHSLGFPPADSDADAVRFAAASAVSRVLNVCNLDRIPPQLRVCTIDIACALFLHAKNSTGQLSTVNLPVKSIREGDTSVSYAEASSIDDLINHLLHHNDHVFAKFRRFSW